MFLPVYLLALTMTRVKCDEEKSVEVDYPDLTKTPSLRHSLTAPVVKVEGEDAMLTCVVRNQGNYTLMWKRSRTKNESRSQGSVLTANMVRVSTDTRLRVMHEPGGEVYVLLIQQVRMSDAGLYTCEVNSSPPLRSFHQLKVLSPHLRPPSPRLTTQSSIPLSSSESVTKDSISVWGYSTENPVTHDFTDCCVSKNVSTTCQSFCNLKNILDGSTGVDPSQCEGEFPSIVSCMADGRDHLPCCLEAGIPLACTDLCRGEYTTQTDNIKTQFSCAAHTAPTLACIAAGIETLPRQPEDFSVQALNDTAIRVTWHPATEENSLTDHYKINVTYLQFLSPVFSVGVDTAAKDFYPPNSALHTVERTESEVVVGNLEKFAIYEVSMWAVSAAGGRSLPTYSEKVVTHLEGGQAPPSSPSPSPSLPDVKSCCVRNNVTHASCLDKFCDPVSVGSASLADLMICAPWDFEMFSCLADGRDHTPCCAAKQMPTVCQELCSGNVRDINFQYFRCIEYMQELSSCVLSGYGVLPSSPVNFRFSNLHTDFGILHWEAPEKLGETVIDYIVNYKKISPVMGSLQTARQAHSPYILEGLESSYTYEVYVEAVNQHGVGEASSRIVFRTASRKISDLLEKQHPYNQTECCIKSGIKKECLPLCSYDASLTQINSLSTVCADDFSTVIRCGAGGRDHLPCCNRRGVPSHCQPLCQAVHQTSTGAHFMGCLPHMGQVVLCYEEGTAKLPPPVRDFRAISVQDGSVVLDWKFPTNGTFNTTHFEVYYKLLPLNASSAPVFGSDKQKNSSVPVVKITGLEVGRKYSFFVVSRNSAGTSLPSSIITVNTSAQTWNPSHGVVRGASSPPHLLAVESHSATWLQFTWNTPAISHPENIIKYRLFYRQVSSNSSNYSMVETDLTTVTLHGLSPNTQYTLYTTAITSYRNDTSLECELFGGDDCTSPTPQPSSPPISVESAPSETLIAWTDPAFPAFVEAPTIHPIDRVEEGMNMTILCIAMGTPLPTVTLYINGHPLRSSVTRHMVTMVHNVTRDMGQVSCYADNGYGTPMQASRRITISRKPTMTAPSLTTVMKGDTLKLKCTVDAYPAPAMAVFRDSKLRHSLQTGGNIAISAQGDENSASTWYLHLEISNIDLGDQHSYFCHANNTLGEAVKEMKVNITTMPPPVLDVSSCCASQNVSSDCLDVCTFSVDLDLLSRRPNCISQFHKVMSCASDGSDHRHCCSLGKVPSACLDWCRGVPVQSSELCALSYSPTILRCFHEGSHSLPGPPRDVKVRPLDRSSAKVMWEAPRKNPRAVELYRVFWRPTGAKDTNKSDTVSQSLTLHSLQPGTEYELVVKAGNSNGTSQLTQPLKFVTADKYIIAATTPVQGANTGGAVGIVVAVVLVLAMVIAILFVMKKKNMLLPSTKKPESPSVAFENPFYATRDPGIVTQAGTDEYNVHISSSGSWHSELNSSNSNSSSNSPQPSTAQNSPGQHRAELEVSEENKTGEDNPGMFAKFGQGKGGFTRFK